MCGRRVCAATKEYLCLCVYHHHHQHHRSEDDYRSEGDDEYDTNAKNNILALDDYDLNLSYLLDDQVGDD